MIAPPRGHSLVPIMVQLSDSNESPSPSHNAGDRFSQARWNKTRLSQLWRPEVPHRGVPGRIHPEGSGECLLAACLLGPDGSRTSWCPSCQPFSLRSRGARRHPLPVFLSEGHVTGLMVQPSPGPRLLEILTLITKTLVHILRNYESTLRIILRVWMNIYFGEPHSTCYIP